MYQAGFVEFGGGGCDILTEKRSPPPSETEDGGHEDWEWCRGGATIWQWSCKQIISDITQSKRIAAAAVAAGASSLCCL